MREESHAPRRVEDPPRRRPPNSQELSPAPTPFNDAVDATLTVVASQKAEGQVYNVGTAREVSINYLARCTCDLYGVSLDPEYVDRRDIDNIRRRVVGIEQV